MSKPVRITLSVIAGVVLWGVLWNLGSMLTMSLFPDQVQPEQPIASVGILIGLIVYSVILSVGAGFSTAKIGKEHARSAVHILAGVQFAIGAFFEYTYWELMPAWYHIIFVALVIPFTVIGGNKAGMDE